MSPISKKYDQYMAVGTESGDGMQWHDADESPMVLEGFHWRAKGRMRQGDEGREEIGGGWGDRGASGGRGGRRLPPSSPSQPLPEGVDRFADHSAGGQLRFKTDSKTIMVKVSLQTMDNAADIMTYSRIGFDLYVGPPSNPHFIGITRLNFDDVTEHECSFVASVLKSDRSAMREFTLNFPLYASIQAFALGLEPGSRIEAPSPRLDDRPIVVYGTSIQQGCCASRPGLCHTNLMSRWLNRPFINLGFAGSGKGEPEVARVLATVKNPAMFVLDYDSNSSLESLAATLGNFTDILRQAHRETPILTVSRMRYMTEYPMDAGDPICSEDRIKRTAIHVENMRRGRASGDRNIHFLDGFWLFGDEDFHECTADGVHANDLGFYRMARVMAGEIRRILG